ncbi:MAG: hypothetical protein KA987_15480 [Saprospiraceae bacterium]|nr:hypothetical protein [Saprospiraceae bacterium]
MVIERTNNEIVIRINDDNEQLGQDDLDKIIDTIRYYQIIKKSKASQNDIDVLAKEISANWWNENKARFETK